jgi:hypothetical protein
VWAGTAEADKAFTVRLRARAGHCRRNIPRSQLVDQPQMSPTLIVVFRLVHIVAGAVWVGASRSRRFPHAVDHGGRAGAGPFMNSLASANFPGRDDADGLTILSAGLMGISIEL